MTQLPIALDLIAIATGGLFGSALAVQRRMPLVAVMLIGILMALGGGMFRDLLLDVPVVAVHNAWYIPTAVFAALIGMPLARRTVENSLVGLSLDALVLGTYVLVGTQKAVLLGMPLGSSIFVGVLTAVGGGTIVEMMLGSKPNVLRDGPWFASAALVGAVIVVLGHGLIDPNILAAITIATVAIIRITSVRLGYTAPSVANIQKLRRNRAE
jgi:uncharacterized membrane protein YeiH